MLGGLVEIVDTINTQFMDRQVKNSEKSTIDPLARTF